MLVCPESRNIPGSPLPPGRAASGEAIAAEAPSRGPANRAWGPARVDRTGTGARGGGGGHGQTTTTKKTVTFNGITSLQRQTPTDNGDNDQSTAAIRPKTRRNGVAHTQGQSNSVNNVFPCKLSIGYDLGLSYSQRRTYRKRTTCHSSSTARLAVTMFCLLS